MYLVVVRIWQMAVRPGIHAFHPRALGRCHGVAPAGPGGLSLSSQDSKALSGTQLLSGSGIREAGRALNFII